MSYINGHDIGREMLTYAAAYLCSFKFNYLIKDFKNYVCVAIDDIQLCQFFIVFFNGKTRYI